MRLVFVCLAVGLTHGCGGDSRCDRFVDETERECIRTSTQSIYIGGKKVGQLQDDDAARASCHKDRVDSRAWCRKAPDDVVACATKPPDDPGRKGARCQDILSRYWDKTHPGDHHHDDVGAAAPVEPDEVAAPVALPPPPTPAPTTGNDLPARVNQLWAAGKYDDAIAELEHGIPGIEEQVGPDHPAVAVALRYLGSLRIKRGHPGDAIAELERAVTIDENALGPDSVGTAGCRFVLAQALWDSGRDHKRARSLAEQARAVVAADPTLAADLASVDEWLAGHK
jgi:hypothetical protein